MLEIVIAQIITFIVTVIFFRFFPPGQKPKELLPKVSNNTKAPKETPLTNLEINLDSYFEKEKKILDLKDHINLTQQLIDYIPESDLTNEDKQKELTLLKLDIENLQKELIILENKTKPIVPPKELEPTKDLEHYAQRWSKEMSVNISEKTVSTFYSILTMIPNCRNSWPRFHQYTKEPRKPSGAEFNFGYVLLDISDIYLSLDKEERREIKILLSHFSLIGYLHLGENIPFFPEIFHNDLPNYPITVKKKWQPLLYEATKLKKEKSIIQNTTVTKIATTRRVR